MPPRYVTPGGPGAGEISEGGVRSGDVVLAANDLGFGPATRTYCSHLCGGRGACAGFGWHLNGLPHLINGSKQIIVFFGPLHAYWYDVSGSSYTPLFGAREALHHDAEKHLFKFLDASGTVYEFYDFDSSHAGQFRRGVTAGGAAIEVTEWTAQGNIKTVQYKISDTAIACKLWEYSYITGGKNDGRLQSIVLRGRSKASQSWTDNETQVSRATYNYYVTARSEPNGRTGDLKMVVRQSWHRNSWAGDDTYYYRYYTDPPRAHLLKMDCSLQSYVDAKAVYPDPTSSKVSDQNLLRFSSRYYDYDADRQVIRARVGGREFRYSYTRSSWGGKKGPGIVDRDGEGTRK